MDSENTKHNRILAERKNQVLKRNMELTSDGVEDLDIQQELYRKHADEVESVLNEIGVGHTSTDGKKKTQDDRHNQYINNAADDDYDREDEQDDYDDYGDVDEIDDADDYLEEDGLLDLFSFARKKKKTSSRDRRREAGVKANPVKKANYNMNSGENHEVQTEEYHTEEILNQEELEELEQAIEAGEYEKTASDAQNAGIYESFGGYSPDDEEMSDDISEKNVPSDNDRLFSQRLIKEKTPKTPKLSSNIKWIIALCIMLVLFIGLTACYLSKLASLKYGEMDINLIHKDELVVNDGVADKVSGYKTIVLYGVDSRESNLSQGTNSDTIIIVSINEETKDVKIVSVYRDTLFGIQNDEAVTQKVNYAYQMGGAVMSMSTLNANLDLYITDYVAVDFAGLANIIDAIGGVEIDITDAEINNLNKNLAEQIRLSGIFSDGVYSAGRQILNGQQAVAYSRIRSTDKGDITRTKRQRDVLLQIIDKVCDLDGDSISALIDVSFGCISTSFTKTEAMSFAKDLDKYKISDSVGFPFAYSAVNLGTKGNVLVAADMAGNVAKLHEYLYGDVSYSPSGKAGSISDNIAAETGVAAQTVDIPVSSDDKGSGEAGNNVETIKEPPSGMILDE